MTLAVNRRDSVSYQPRKTTKKPDELPPGQRKLLAQAQMYEAELGIMHGELLAVEDVRDTLSDAMIALGRFLDTLPSRMRTELALPDDVAHKASLWIDDERRLLAEKFEGIFKESVKVKKTKHNRLA